MPGKKIEQLEAKVQRKNAVMSISALSPFTLKQYTGRQGSDCRQGCSAGIAADIDMSLHVVGRLLGQTIAMKTARHMEYPWSSGRLASSFGGRRVRTWGRSVAQTASRSVRTPRPGSFLRSATFVRGAFLSQFLPVGRSSGMFGAGGGVFFLHRGR